MTVKNLLETVLLSQRITLKELVDLNECEDRLILDQIPQQEVPYCKIAEFLDSEVQTVEAVVDPQGQPYLYIEI